MKNYFLFFNLFISLSLSEQFYFDDFSENTFPPIGWETSGTPIDSNRWEIDNSTNSYNTTPPALAYHWSPSTPGNYEPYSHEMLSPSIDVSGNTSVLVFFDIALDFWGASNFTNGMTISYNGGNGWVDILNYEIGPGAGFVEINRRTESFIAEIVSGNNIQLKFLAYGTNSYYIDDWFIDNVEVVSAPKLNIVSISSSNENSNKGVIGDQVFIDISSNTDLISDPIVQMNGNICNVSFGGSNRWTASYTVQVSDPDGPVEFTIDFTDINNIDGITVRQSTDNTNVILDNSDPPNFVVGNVSSIGGNEYIDIWNETNLNINLEVSVPQDSAVSSYDYINGNSLLFDGINDQVSISNISDYQFNNQLTIEAWIKPLSSVENYTGFLNRATDSGPLEAGYGFVFFSTGWHFFIKTDLPNTIDYTTMPVASAPVNQWTHLAAIYTGSKVVLFRNGIALDSSVVYGDLEWSGAPDEIILGSFTKDGTTEYFNGQIDDVRVWNTVRTRQEIKVYRKIELNGDETGLVGYWKIDEDSGEFINDFTSNFNNGVINGSSWVQGDSPLQFKTPIYDTGVIIGSMFQLLGRVGSNTFEQFGSRDTIRQVDFDNGIKNVSASKLAFEDITDFSHGQIAQLRAYLYDDAGNYSVGDISNSNILVDIIANQPNPVSIQSNNQFQNLARTDDIVTVSLFFDEDVNSPSVYINDNNSDNINNLGEGEFESTYQLTGSELNGRLEILINVMDSYGNQDEYSGTTDGTIVRYDNIIPILNQVSINSNNEWNESWAKSGDSIQILIESSEDLFDINALIQDNSSSISLISLDEYIVNYVFSSLNTSDTVDFEISYSDSAGNIGEIVTNTTNNSYVVFDKINPSAFSVGDVISTGGNIVSGAWNSTNTGIEIIIPIDNDESLDSGRVQVQAKIGENDFEDLDNYHFINLNEIDNIKTIAIADNFIKSISGFSENDTITFNANIFDIPGNMTNGNQSMKRLIINESLPLIINSNIESNFSDSSLAGVGNIISLSFETDTEIQVPSVLSFANINYTILDDDVKYFATYIMKEIDTEGEISFEIIVTDSVGITSNPVNETTNGTFVIFDRTAPIINSLHIESSNSNDNSIGISGDEINLSFSSSEILKIDSIFVNIADQNVSILENDGLYIASYVLDGTEPSGYINYNLNYQDLAGNQGAPLDSTQDSSYVKHDLIPPEIVKCYISSNNADSSWAKEGDSIFVTFISSEPLNNIEVNISNVLAGLSQINPYKYVALLRMESSYQQGEVPFLITYTDLGGIAGDDVTTTTNSSLVKFDSQIPSIENVIMKTNNIYGDTLAGIGTIDTLRFSISEFYRSLNIKIDNKVNIPTENNLDFVSINTFEEMDSSYWVTFSISMVDSAGNQSQIINQDSIEDKVWFDGQRPILDSVLIFSNNSYNSSVCTIGDSVYVRYSSSEILRSKNISIANTFPNRIYELNGFNYAVYCITGNEDEGIIPFNIFDYEDFVGNLGLDVNNSSNGEKIIFDMTSPSEFELGNIYSKEGNEKSGYWNYSNRSLEITAPIDNDTTLVEGFIQIQVKFDELYNDLGDQISISENSLGRDTVIIIEGDLFINQEEFENGEDATFRAMVWDKSGNSVTSDSSNSLLYIDTINPVISNIFIKSNNLDTTLAKVGDSLFISFETNELLDSISIFVYNNLCSFQSIDFNVESFYQFQESDIEGFVPFSIYSEDLAGNINPIIYETSDSSRVLFDKTNPNLEVVQFYSSNSYNPELATIGDTLFLNVLSSELLSDIDMYISENEGVYNIVDTIISNNMDNHSFLGYKILNGTEEEGFILFKIAFSDLAGNIADTVNVTTDNSSILIDRTSPEDFYIEDIFANNGNEIDGYWNSTNDNLVFLIPIPNDNTLPGGGIQIQSSFSDSNYLNLGSSYFVSEEDLNQNKIIIISKEQFEVLEGFNENVDVDFRANIWDKAGNMATSLDSNINHLHIDIIDPIINSINIFSNNAFDSSWAKISDSIFINYTSSESLSISKVIINNNLSNSLNNYDFYWNAFSVVTDDYKEGIINFDIIIEDLAGNSGDTISYANDSSFVNIDKTSPKILYLLEGNDSLDFDYYNNSESILLHLDFFDSLAGVKDIFISYSQDTSNLDSITWTKYQIGELFILDSLDLLNNNIYHGGAYVIDYAGNTSNIVFGDGFLVDLQIPDTGMINDGQWFLEMDYTPDSTSLKYNWNGFSDNIGIRNFELSIGTNNNKTNILDWFKTDSSEKITIKDLFLDRDTCYFTYMRAYDSALNISEIIKTDGIYFDDSEPRVIKISPDINDSLGFLSIQNQDTINIKFNRNIFFYDLSIKSSVDSNFNYSQFYTDSVLTIALEDTLASYDTLTIFLDSALAYNTLFVSETLYFYSQLWGDLNSDYDIDIKDIYIFNKQWPTIDLGPFHGIPPNIYPNLDGKINLIDMSSFAKMWHWRYFNLSFDSINHPMRRINQLGIGIKGNKVQIRIPEDVYMAEFLIGSTNLNISDFNVFNLSPSTFIFESIDNINSLKQFSLADQNGLDSTFKIIIPKESEEYLKAQIQHVFLSKNGDTISYNNEKFFFEIVPDEFRVYDNYPNPFNPLTNIRFDLVKRNNVYINVYDILGREVLSIIKILNAGRHQFLWEGLNNNGNKVSSGVYFFTLKTGDNFHIQKMLLLK